MSPGPSANPATLVVIIEDEALVRLAVAAELIQAGFLVIEATNAAEALAILKSKASEVHVLVTDIQMPGSIDGLELARVALDHWPWIRLIVASGRTGLAREKLPAGIRLFPKPYDPRDLAATIREMVTAQ